VKYKCDEIRTESEETRNRLHQAYLDFLGFHGIEYQLLSGNVSSRSRQVKDFIKEAEVSL